MRTADSTAAALAQKALTAFSVDEGDDEFRARVREHVGLTAHDAHTIQCVGMVEPIALLDLYQPTRLKQGVGSVDELLAKRSDAVVYAGPGQGKTTLLRYLLLTLADGRASSPLLFVLRTQGHIELLCEFVNVLDTRRRLNHVPPCSPPLLLLVDGYDEILDSQQKVVSDVLVKFAMVRAGNFILTCRSGYSVHSPSCGRYDLADFERDDAIRYVDAFTRAVGLELDGFKLVTELEERKLNYIASHPLMLTLACVVKTSANPQLPHNSVDLLRQSIETLAFRWDESKRVRDRRSVTGLLSIHMLQCAMRVAHEMTGLSVSSTEVIGIVAEYLKLLHREELLPEDVLGDIRRFFGLITITPDGRCQFAHKTIHDYLSARYAVENGLFQPARIVKWDMRAAFAASLQHDATFSLHNAFVHARDIEAVRECFLNGARFDADAVANAVFLHFDRFRDFKYIHSLNRPINVSADSDFFDVADGTFLDAIMRKASVAHRSTALSVVVVYCLSEYKRRGVTVPAVARSLVEELFKGTDVIVVSRHGVTETLMWPMVVGRD